MKAALLVALVLLAGACSASKYKNRRINDIADSQQDQIEKAQPFRSGYEYLFKYDGQIVSGLDVTGPNSVPVANDDPQQSAATRIQAQAKIVFESDRQATLRLQHVKLGHLNQPIESPQQVQPMQMFESAQVENQQIEKLEYPLQFDYAQGVVERIQFHKEDPIWSRNIKRAVLQLIQLNLKKQPMPEDSNSQPWPQSPLDSAEQRYDQQEEESQSPFKTFTLPEITIEGECQTTYTISKNKQNRNSQNNGEQSSEQETTDDEDNRSFNVTKTVDFKKCRKIADVAFGYQSQQQQPQCIKCKQIQSAEQQQADRSQAQQCSEECDPKEVKEQKLDRITVLRFVLNGKTPEQEYGIKRAELLSQYVFKNLRADSGAHSSAMQTTVVARLVFKAAQPKQEQRGPAFRADTASQKSTLLYDNEFDVEEKRFYMNGERDFQSSKLPFENVRGKTEQAQKILQFLLRSISDKSHGMEYNDAAKLQNLVELLRMCTVTELKEIYDQATASQSSQRNPQQQKAVQLLADAMAIAGTHSTISVLTEKIRETELSAKQASQALQQLTSLPAPSDKQATLVLHLCENEVVRRDAGLKQTCWLTFGSIVGEVCQQKKQQGQESVPIFGTQSGYMNQQQCTTASKKKFQQAIVKEYESAQSIYDQILALKAIGNTGMDITVHFLEQIASDRQENPIVRANAIDAMRRLRTQMPRKVQRVLLPIVQDTRDHPAVRMMAFHILMQTTPQQPVLDQVTYTLSKERNPQVQSLIYSVLKAMSNSKVHSQREIARHLKNTLSLTNVNEESLRASRRYQIPIYSDEQKEGVFLNLVSAFFGRNTILPNHMSATLDTLLNDELEIDALRVAFTQQGLEQWYEGLVQSVFSSNGQSGSKTRAARSSANPRQQSEDKLRQIFNGIDMKPRKSAYRQDDDSLNGQDQRQIRSKQPFALFAVRIGDVDTTVLNLDRHSMPACLRNLAAGERFSVSECIASLQDTQHFQYLKTMNLIEKTAKIPTSMGIPLRITQSMPVLASIEGSLKANPDRSEGFAVNAQVKAQPSICAVHILKMHTWTPFISTGVQSTRAAELNIPVDAQIQVNSELNVKVSMKTPSMQSRLLGFHSLPSTFVCQYDPTAHLLKEPQLKSIHIQYLEQLQREINDVYGQEVTGIPFKVEGHVHQPADPTDYKQLVQLAMATENHLHVKFESNRDESPKEIIFQAKPSAFAKESGRGPSLDNFYSKDSAFDAPGEEFEDVETHEQRRSKLNTYLENFPAGKLYKHELTVSVQTKGGRKELKAQATGTASCDKQMKYCHVTMDAKRTPMLSKENSDWTLRSKLQILNPETVSNVQQLEASNAQKNLKLMVQGEAEWGTTEHKQSISLRIQGEKAHTKEWRNRISNSFQGAQQKFQQKQAAFINKFDLVADYKLRSQAQNFFERAFETLKGYSGFWNTDAQYQQGRNGQIRGSVVIDPITQKHVNISVKTPTQTVQMGAIELPMKAQPFPLVRQAQRSAHSAPQMLNRIAVEQARAECSVDGKRVETFDDVVYKAPIGKCYSILAQDCSNKDQPQFSVLMKSLGNGQDKKILVVTQEQTIECQPSSNMNKKLVCSVNGQTVNADNDNENSQQSSDERWGPVVEYNNEDQTDVSINVKGVHVRFGCWGSQGCKNQKVWIKLSSMYKESQCGLCGHYDDQNDDEWRMADNQLTGDLKKFHKSYTVRSIHDGDCSNDDQSQLYSESNNGKFKQISHNSYEDMENQQNDEDDISFFGSERKRNSKKIAENEDEESYDDEENQWQAGAYHSSSEEDQWGLQSTMKRVKKAKQNKRLIHQHRNQQKNGNSANSPVPATKVMEYSHKVCFSVDAVMQCPPGTHQQHDEEERNEPKSVKFVCIPRSDPEARRLDRQARQGEILDMSDYTPETSEPIREPTSCAVY